MNRSALILVVSGEELWGVERLRQALSEAGFQTAAVEEGLAPGWVGPITPKLVIANLSGSQDADVQMCRELSRGTEVPVMAVGSSRDEQYILAMFAAGANDYLPRPVNTRELVARVRNILHRTQPGLAVPELRTPAALVEPAIPTRKTCISKISGRLKGLSRQILKNSTRESQAGVGRRPKKSSDSSQSRSGKVWKE